MAPTSTQWSTLLIWVSSSPVMLQSARISTTACPMPAVPFEDCQREYGRVIRSSLHENPGIQSRHLYHPSVLCRDLGSPPEAVQTGFINAACTPSWHLIARPRFKRRSPQENWPVQHRVHLASGAAAKAGNVSKMDRRRKHTQGSVFQRAPRRKA